MGLVLLGSAGCRSSVSVVGEARVDKGPPYSFDDMSSPLDSVTFAADGLRGLAVGSSGAVLRSADGGETWQRVHGLPWRVELRSVALSSDGSLGCAVGDYGVVLRTRDAGVTWQQVAPIPTGASLRSIALSADGQRGWIVGGAGSVLRSSDACQTWQKVENIPENILLESVAFAADGLHGVAAGDDGVMVHTSDGGKTWLESSGVSEAAFVQALSLSADGVHGWAVGEHGALYLSADGGASWTKVDGVPTEGYLNGVVFGKDGLHGWAVGDYSTVLTSSDGGRTWAKISGVPTGEDIYSVAFSGDGRRGWAAGDFGTLLLTTDAGQTWRKTGGPPVEVSLRSVAFAADSRHGWAAGRGGALLHTSDGGETWQKSAGVPAGAELESVVFAPGGLRGWAVGEKGIILHSEDGGQSWQEEADPGNALVLYAVAFAPDGLRGWAVGAAGTILATSDGGKTWQKHPGVPTAMDLYGVAFLPDGLHGWAVGAAGTVLRTVNGGQAWEKAVDVRSQRTLRSVVFAADGREGLVVGDWGTVLGTLDGGKTWQFIMGEVSAIPASSVAFASDGLRGWLVGGEGYVFRTVDGGRFWWMLAHDPKEGVINSVAMSADGEHAWAVGEHGTMLLTSSSTLDSRPLEGRLSVRLETRDGAVRPIVTLDGRDPTRVIQVNMTLTGPRANGDLAKAFNRYAVLGQAIDGWKSADLGPGVYTCHVEVFDGWNILTQQFQFGSGPWLRFVGFMGWDIAFSQPLAFARDHGTQNLVLVLVLYCLVIGGLFVFKPSLFVLWHEKAAPLIAVLPIPNKATDKVTQIAGLFLITRARALDAVVAEFAPIALAEMEKLPEAAARPKWVAAPIQVEDELFGRTASPFGEAAALPRGELYVRGLTELKRHLVHRRWWLSIEGPGGVGKSALAFQLARWFAAPEPQSRLNISQAIPIFVRSLKEDLDTEVLAELRRILELPKMSDQLAEALLSQRRVLVIIDGISEKATDLEALEVGPLNPAKGAGLTHFAVMTSRRRIQMAEVVKVLPKPVDLGTIDAVLSLYLDDVVGAGRFTPSQREAIRDSLKGIMKEMAREKGEQPQIPMVFVKLIIQRADDVLAKDDSSSAAPSAEAPLPKDLAELVDAYLSSLLEARPDGMAEAGQARRAALACIGQDGIPKSRPMAAYEARSLTHEQLEGLVVTGLMVKDDADVGDPRYKFALDPIAEYLAAKELVIAVRDARMTLAQLKDACALFSAVSDVAAKVAQIGRALGVKVE